MARYMTAVLGWIGVFLFASAPTLTLAGSPPSPPSPPATAPAATASLGKGRLAYAPPDGWDLVDSASNDNTAAYISSDHLGILAIQLLPVDAIADASAGPAIIRQLKANHTRAKQKMLLVPTIVKDKRFLLAIHERYDDAEGHVNDELHLYTKVGPMHVMLTVNARTDDPDLATKTQAIGENVLVSAKVVKKK